MIQEESTVLPEINLLEGYVGRGTHGASFNPSQDIGVPKFLTRSTPATGETTHLTTGGDTMRKRSADVVEMQPEVDYAGQHGHEAVNRELVRQYGPREERAATAENWSIYFRKLTGKQPIDVMAILISNFTYSDMKSLATELAPILKITDARDVTDAIHEWAQKRIAELYEHSANGVVKP